jgi:hypothetical protein
LEYKAELEKLSVEFGYLWGEKPNVSALLKAIADGDICYQNLTDPQNRNGN